MFDPRRNVLHTADGRLAPKSSTSEADVRRIVREALDANAASGIVLNFHGGLVSESAARETAEQRLYPLYADRGKAYPIFFVTDMPIRLVAFLIWPTSLLFLANEGATTSIEVVINFAKAVAANTLVYMALGSVAFALIAARRRCRVRGARSI